MRRSRNQITGNALENDGVKKSSVVALLLLGFCISCLNAQSNKSSEQKSATSPKIVEFTESYDKRFLKRDPKIGTRLPNVQAFDERGEPLELDSTRGKYTVVVFGCLT